MADKKVVVDLLVNSANSANSIKEMNKALKDLKDAQASVQHGSADWKKLSNAINETEGKIGDLNDSFNTLRGSGVERLNTSFGLFKEGLMSFDFGKVGIALKGLGAAFKAVLPFAIIEGFKYLYENWDKVVEFAGKIIPALSNVSAETKRLQKQTDELTQSNKELNSIYETHIILLEAMGNKEKEISDLKKDILANDTKQLELQLQLNRAKEEDAAKTSTMYEEALKLFHFDQMANESRQERLKEFSTKSEEIEGQLSKKRAEASALRIKDIDAEIKKIKEHSDAVIKRMIDENQEEKKTTDNYLKNLEEKKKADDQARKEKYQKDQELLMQSLKDEEYLRAQDELDKKKRMEDADALAQYEADKLNYSAQIQENVSANEKKNNDKLEQDKKDAIDAGFRHAQLVTQNLQAISDVAFSLRSSKVKKGSAEEEALMKRQFEVNKKLQVAQTVISTITGAREAYKSLATIPIVGPGLGIAAAAAATLAGLSAIQKINSTKFEGATAPTPDSGGGGIGSVGASNNAPSTTNAPSTQPFTKLDESGRNQSMPTVKAYVVESEMTDSQKRVGRLESQASF